MLHPNSLKLIKLNDEAINLGWNKKNPNLCFCQEVARKSNEMDSEYPSDKAIK